MLNLWKIFKLRTLYLQFFLIFFLVACASASDVSIKAQLLKNLPLKNDNAVLSLPEPTPNPSPVAKLIVNSPIPKAEVKVSSDNKVLGANSGSLCKDKKGSWTMVADPNREGIFTICNVVAEKMATVEELNREQNNYRVGHNLNALNINSGLCKIAGERAQEISKNFSHDGFEAAIERSGVGKNSFGENIASGPLGAVHFVEWSWDRSPGHKANMLGDWTDGCGGVFDKYAVFMFAK